MELKEAAVYRLTIPMTGTYSAAHHPDLQTMSSVLVELRTTDGSVGIGTADSIQGYSHHSHDEIESSLVDDIIPLVLDEQPGNPNAFLSALDAIDDAANAKCAVESAFLDLYGKDAGLSVSELLGGSIRDPQPLNAWVGFDEPEQMANEARAWSERGFESVKIKLEGDAETDVERVRAVCSAVGPEMEVRADANEAYAVDSAIEVARALEDCHIAHFEQPIPGDDIDGLAEVTASTSVPIMADEALSSLEDIRTVLERNAADRLKVKILRLGGVLNTRRALDFAQVFGISCVVGHGFCLTPAASAEIQLASTHDNVFGPVETVGSLKMTDEPFEPSLTITDGSANLPTGTGLGVSIREDGLNEFRDRMVTVP